MTLVTAKNGGLTRAQTDCGAPQLTEMEATSTIYVPWPESCGQPVTKSRKGQNRLKQDKRSTIMRAYAGARLRALKDNCSRAEAARRARDAYRIATKAWDAQPESCGQPVTKSRKGRIRLKQDKRSTLMRAYASARIRALKDNCSGEVAARRGRDAYRTATKAWALCEAV